MISIRVGRRVDSKAMKNRESSRAEKVRSRANKIKNTVDMKVRWDLLVYFFVDLILARRAMGISHVLRTIRGEDNLSTANFSESLCHRVKECSFSVLTDRADIAMAFIMDTFRYSLLLITQGIRIADKDKVRRYIIIR